jgi:hypothetical protein
VCERANKNKNENNSNNEDDMKSYFLRKTLQK